MNNKTIAEIRTDYIDDDNLIHIDCWFTEDDNEEGRTIAVVDGDTKKVIFFDNGFRGDEKIKKAINEIITSLESEQFDNQSSKFLSEREVINLIGQTISELGGDEVSEVYSHVRSDKIRYVGDSLWEQL